MIEWQESRSQASLRQEDAGRDSTVRVRIESIEWREDMIDPECYNINLRRVTVDGEMLYEARVWEFLDATEYAESAQEAYELALDTVEASLEVLQEQGKTPPNPSETP